MGNDNWDRINTPPKRWKQTPITDLETRVNELYGNGIFDWTIGKTGPDDGDPSEAPAVWFYYGGTGEDELGRPRWRVSGHASTAADAMIELIAKHDDA